MAREGLDSPDLPRDSIQMTCADFEINIHVFWPTSLS